LQKEVRKHEEEVQRALKIHRANEQLIQSNQQLKKDLEKAQESEGGTETRLREEIESLRHLLREAKEALQ